MPNNKQRVRIYSNGELLCEPLVDKVPDPTSKDGTMLIFPDFNLFVRPKEMFTTRAGGHHYHEDLKPGFYVWVKWGEFIVNDSACLHWSSQVERVLFDDVEPPPLAG
jgi:hypothetical protein